MTAIADLRREHRALASLIATLAPPEPATPVEAERLRRRLAALPKLIDEHLAHEAPLLAGLEEAPAGSALRVANAARQRESTALAEGCASFARHWAHPGAIERDTGAFASALGVLGGALDRLIRREEGEVYPFADRMWSPAPVAPPPLTGIPEVDEDHNAIFGMIGGLRALIGEGPQAVDGEQVAALAAYAETHFAREEALMEATEYPGLEDHRQEHHRAQALLLGFRNDHLDGRHVQAAAVLAFLESWLASHIAEVDQRMAAHVRKALP